MLRVSNYPTLQGADGPATFGTLVGGGAEIVAAGPAMLHLLQGQGCLSLLPFLSPEIHFDEQPFGWQHRKGG
jgi:hypothetical protein